MSDPSEEFDYGLSFGRFTILVAALLALSLLAGTVTAWKTELTVYESMSIIGVLASITLSAILAYLYFRMSQIQDSQRRESVRQADLQKELTKQQEKQNELIELQQEMQELEYQARVLIDDYELTEMNVELTLRNLGRGLAENIAVRTSLRVTEGTVEPRSTPDSDSQGFLYRVEDVFWRDPKTDEEYVPRISYPARVEGGDVMAERQRGGLLSPDEGAVTFRCPVRFGLVNRRHDGVGDVLPETFLRKLYQQGVRDVTFQLDLLYCNELDEISAIPIMGRSGELEHGMEFEDIESLGHRVSGTRQEVRESVKSLGSYPPPE